MFFTRATLIVFGRRLLCFPRVLSGCSALVVSTSASDWLEKPSK